MAAEANLLCERERAWREGEGRRYQCRSISFAGKKRLQRESKERNKIWCAIVESHDDTWNWRTTTKKSKGTASVRELFRNVARIPVGCTL